MLIVGTGLDEGSSVRHGSVQQLHSTVQSAISFFIIGAEEQKLAGMAPVSPLS